MEKPKFVNLSLVEDKEPVNKEIAKISPEELDEICSLNVGERYVFNSLSKQTITEVLNSLATRDLDNELPIAQETFLYKRNVKVCKELKLAVYKLIDIIEKTGEIDQSQNQQLWGKAKMLYVLEKKKAEWLEKNYYPHLYNKTINVARGEVNQFLIKQKNLAILDSFRDISNVQIYLKDELSYSSLKNSKDSIGFYNLRDIYIKIFDYYTESEEWKVFLVAIHELLHAFSYQYYDRMGMNKFREEPDFIEINEAVTEILSFAIASDHLSKFKTPLQGEVRQLSLYDMSYFEYVVILKTILAKVPLSYFTDAMLNEEGLLRLSEKFDQTFKRKNALIWFGKNFRDLYGPQARYKQSQAYFLPSKIGEEEYKADVIKIKPYLKAKSKLKKAKKLEKKPDN